MGVGEGVDCGLGMAATRPRRAETTKAALKRMLAEVWWLEGMLWNADGKGNAVAFYA
jgi:hypothetical protein